MMSMHFAVIEQRLREKNNVVVVVSEICPSCRWWFPLMQKSVIIDTFESPCSAVWNSGILIATG